MKYTAFPNLEFAFIAFLLLRVADEAVSTIFLVADLGKMKKFMYVCVAKKRFST